MEYALGPASPSSSQYSAKVEEELRNIILKRKARNEEVMDWIDVRISSCSFLLSRHTLGQVFSGLSFFHREINKYALSSIEKGCSAPLSLFFSFIFFLLRKMFPL